jgi:hypothetical protein
MSGCWSTRVCSQNRGGGFLPSGSLSDRLGSFFSLRLFPTLAATCLSSSPVSIHRGSMGGMI